MNTYWDEDSGYDDDPINEEDYLDTEESVSEYDSSYWL